MYTRVYGEIAFDSPVLIELACCPTIQRLKEISQAGYAEPYFPWTKHFRFEHSIGVAWLLKIFGAPIEEQIAGLIHDASHLVFSHCADYYIPAGAGETQNHQDNIFADFIRHTDIPTILAKYHFDLDYILDDENFPLKEKKLPDLCADRIDYLLLSAMAYGEITNAAPFLNRFYVQDGQWLLRDLNSAVLFTELFSKMNCLYYSGIQAAAMYLTVGNYMKYALNMGYVQIEELVRQTDLQVLKKINRHTIHDRYLSELFHLMECPSYSLDPEQSPKGRVVCKSRMIDPMCRHRNVIGKLSDFLPEWKNRIREESKPKIYFLRMKK